MKREENYQDNSFGIASVILGIVGSVLGVLVLPVLLSIIGLVFWYNHLCLSGSTSSNCIFPGPAINGSLPG